MSFADAPPAPEVVPPPYEPPGPPPILEKPMPPPPTAMVKVAATIGEWPEWWDDPIAPHEKEEQYRRRDFDADGNWIELGDGQEWCFPGPNIAAAADGNNEFGFGLKFWYGPKFKRLMDEYGDFCDEFGRLAQTGGDAQVQTWKRVAAYHFWIARFLLGMNYDVPLEKLAQILIFRYDQAELDPAVEQILRTAGGWDGPKRPPAGDGSPG